MLEPIRASCLHHMLLCPHAGGHYPVPDLHHHIIIFNSLSPCCAHMLVTLNPHILQELLLLVSEAPEQDGMSGDMLERGLKLVLDSLDQTAVDVPFAPSLARAQSPHPLPSLLYMCI